MNAVRIAVDPELCMGSGTCMSVAPDLFDMGDHGAAVPPQSVVKHIRTLDEAVSRCPTGAITLTDAPTA